MLKLEQHERHRCGRCRSPLRKAGYIAEDIEGVRQFLCLGHLTELLHGLCQPEDARRWPERSVDPQLLTAKVAGYRPGLGSLIEREE